ncbi:hypothetical protein DYB25_008906 [Aphanomyces astaci]|uniref:Helicase C-terminal domain-containing protein n=1 Tax=Aphanomyces astaci TaxID=112090 RepID=A0A397ARV0_APHAT|nr:hypothetical protein DYB25_008906 [Aphanomyces astaci]
MDSFRQFQARILVNLDLPRDPATYLHRVGRSGRFGGQGVAITLLGIPEVKAIKAMANVFKMTVAEWTGQAPPRDEQSREDDDTAYAHSDLPTRIFQRRQQNDKDGEQLDATMTLTPDTTTLPKFSSLHVDTPANFQHESPRLVVAPSPQATTDATPLNSSPTFPPEINVGSPCAAAATSVARKRPSKSKRPPTSPPPTIVTTVDLRNQPTSSHIQRDVSSPQPKPPTKQNHFNNATYLKEEAMYDQWLALVHKSSQS